MESQRVTLHIDNMVDFHCINKDSSEKSFDNMLLFRVTRKVPVCKISLSIW